VTPPERDRAHATGEAIGGAVVWIGARLFDLVLVIVMAAVYFGTLFGAIGLTIPEVDPGRHIACTLIVGSIQAIFFGAIYRIAQRVTAKRRSAPPG